MRKTNKRKPNPQPKGGGKVIVKCKCKCKCNFEEKGERVFLVRVQYINQQGGTK